MSNVTKLTLVSVLLAGIMGCSTQADAPLDTVVKSSTTTIKGTPGGKVTATEELTAKVVELDVAKREFVLQDAAGHRRHVVAPPEMVNFPQLKVGDTVKALLAVETVVYLQDAKNAKQDDAEALAAVAAEGEKPGIMVAGRRQITATVKAVDEKARTATLEFEDGISEVVPVRDDVKLSQDQVGKQVVIVVTVAVATEVSKL